MQFMITIAVRNWSNELVIQWINCSSKSQTTRLSILCCLYFRITIIWHIIILCNYLTCSLLENEKTRIVTTSRINIY
ncbi:unnamed protein product [Blepharisma stoltei]|uniref:Uncharacterized protein n=1 Tax=Blepharisma stoltei TaxID=1481888 RepID=A0AAU9K5Y4_9CILI|nr:unnamed protein product [Blepharisma stoltei]